MLFVNVRILFSIVTLVDIFFVSVNTWLAHLLRHLLLHLLLHQQFAQLLFTDLNHVIFTFFPHGLRVFVHLIIFIHIFIIIHVIIFVLLHDHLAILVNLDLLLLLLNIFLVKVAFFDVLLHAVDAVVVKVHLLTFLLLLTFLVILNLLHKLLLLELFSKGGLLFRIHIGDVFLIEMVVDALHIVHLLLLSILLLIFIFVIVVLPFVRLLVMVLFHAITLVDDALVFLGTLHHFFLIVFVSLVLFNDLVALVALHLVHLLLHLLLLLQSLQLLFLASLSVETLLILKIISTFLQVGLSERISSVLTGEVGRGKVESIVVFGRDEQFLLLVCETGIRIQSVFSQNGYKLLEFFNLAQIVDEGLGDLFDEQGSICHLELNFRLDILVLLVQSGHSLASHRLGSHSLLLQRV